MAMTRWKPSRWTPAMGRPRVLQNVSDEEILLTMLGFGGGLIGGFRWIGKGVRQNFNISPAAGTAVMGLATAAFPLIFGKKFMTTEWAYAFYGIGAGLLSSAIVQFIFPSTSPTP